MDSSGPKDSQVQSSSPARWRQCALMGGHIASTWRIQVNHPSTAAMRLTSNYFDHLLTFDTINITDSVMEFGFEPVCDKLRASFEPASNQLAQWNLTLTELNKISIDSELSSLSNLQPSAYVSNIAIVYLNVCAFLAIASILLHSSGRTPIHHVFRDNGTNLVLPYLRHSAIF